MSFHEVNSRVKTPRRCPTCHDEDINIVSWDPMNGETFECANCKKHWSCDEDGPPNDDWIHEAYLHQASPNPKN